MDIKKTIEDVRSLITNKKPDELFEPLNTLVEYVFTNFFTLCENKNVKQQIIDCLQLGGNQILVLSPHNYTANLFIATAHSLNGDVRALCQSTTAFVEEDRKITNKPFDADSFAIFLCLRDMLPNFFQQRFITSLSSAFEKNYPETAATYYLRSLIAPISNKEQILDYLCKAVELDSEFVEKMSHRPWKLEMTTPYTA